MSRAPDLLAAFAALMGAAGVALAAASTHSGGGDLGRTAAEFLILHAAALIGVASGVRAETGRRRLALLVAGGGLGLGAALFSGDLAARAFEATKLFPMAAPLGGSLMILAWIAFALVFAVAP